MKNQDFAALAATGLPIRFASQKSNLARVYLGDVYETFMDNRDSRATLEAKAPNAKYGTHLGSALARLARRTDEAYHVAAEKASATFAAELLSFVPAASQSRARRI